MVDLLISASFLVLFAVIIGGTLLYLIRSSKNDSLLGEDTWIEHRQALFERIAREYGLTFSKETIPEDQVLVTDREYPWLRVEGTLNSKSVRIDDHLYIQKRFGDRRLSIPYSQVLTEAPVLGYGAPPGTRFARTVTYGEVNGKKEVLGTLRILGHQVPASYKVIQNFLGTV